METQQKNIKSIIVFGGTGFYGRIIVKKLVEKNERVKVLSRNAIKAQEILGEKVEIIEGDVSSKETVINTLQNVKAILICLSTANKKLIKRMKEIERDAVLMILDEAKKINICRVVYSSGYEMRPDVLENLNLIKFGEIKLEIENTIRNSDFNWTILGYAPAFDLFFTFLRNNKLVVPGGGLNPVPTVSPTDVGEIAAQTIIRTDLNKKRFRITGKEAISFPQFAEKVSKITGKKIKHIKIPLAIFRIVSIIILPFNPFLRFIYWSLKLLNNFPKDLAEDVPKDHEILLKTFSYNSIDIETEIKQRLMIESMIR